jgi:hypothetical protein
MSFLHLSEEFQAKDPPLAELRNSLSAVILIGAKKRRKLALNEAEAELMLLFGEWQGPANLDQWVPNAALTPSRIDLPCRYNKASSKNQLLSIPNLRGRPTNR